MSIIRKGFVRKKYKTYSIYILKCRCSWNKSNFQHQTGRNFIFNFIFLCFSQNHLQKRMTLDLQPDIQCLNSSNDWLLDLRQYVLVFRQRYLQKSPCLSVWAHLKYHYELLFRFIWATMFDSKFTLHLFLCIQFYYVSATSITTQTLYL